MIRLLFIFFFLFCITLTCKPQNIDNIRREYYAALQDSKSADKLYTKLKSSKDLPPELLAYFGCAQALKARYSWNPYNKLLYLKDAKETLEDAVEKKPESLEIRFLRFSLEHYIPSFLGMSENLSADKKKIIQLIQSKQVGTVNEDLLKNLIAFMKSSKRCTSEELAILSKGTS
ncbi:hypothetical protein [Rubrolithibacter danxiaensis]|uniref:hypothetical protein n=1 Tax=Rubrolithibacter danxiaensis TaxID=3390805 RepID=UPI003BF92788